MNLGIEGKTALVVGASGDTGQAVAVALAREGCKLLCVSRGGERMEQTIAAMPQDARIEYYKGDLMDRLRLVGFLTQLDTSGIPDIIVHVIGGSLGLRDPYLTAEDYAKVALYNLGIPHEINRHCIPKMIERGWGRIVHFSSNGVKLATGTVPYIAAKGAVEAYVRNFSKELSPKGVVMTAVSPGPIYTAGRGMYNLAGEALATFQKHYVPMARWGRGEELASVIAFLCGQQASYMAGSIVDVDGGMR